MSDSDELARDLSAADADTWEKMAENLLAAGYRKPRKIGIEELGDLETPGIVVRDAEGRVAELSKDEGFGNVWKPTMPDTWQDAKFGLEACMFKYPVTVLYTPEEPR